MGMEALVHNACALPSINMEPDSLVTVCILCLSLGVSRFRVRAYIYIYTYVLYIYLYIPITVYMMYVAIDRYIYIYTHVSSLNVCHMFANDWCSTRSCRMISPQNAKPKAPLPIPVMYGL